MPTLSLTDFVDIAGKTGTTKATKIAEVKHRPKYNPAFDFYKALREGIAEAHQNNQPKGSLDQLLSHLTDSKKQANYPAAIAGYKKWWGKKQVVWFTPPRAEYLQSGISVTINPELGLEINGQRFIIKLYFKPEPVPKLRMDIVLELMGTALGAQCKKNETLALLDVRQSKLFTLGPVNKTILAMVNAELAYVASIWPSL